MTFSAKKSIQNEKCVVSFQVVLGMHVAQMPVYSVKERKTEVIYYSFTVSTA